MEINDAVSDKFSWLLEHFSRDEIAILEQEEYLDDDCYLRSIEGMVKSIHDARNEPAENGVTLDRLEW